MLNSISAILPEIRQAAEGVDWLTVLQTAAFYAVGIFLLGAFLRSVLGKDSPFIRAVSATVSILMIYLAAILLYVFAPSLRSTVNQLPFLLVNAQRCALWDIASLSGELLYPALLKLSILALVVNTLEEFMPKGKKFWSWYLWRCVTVAAGLGLYILACETASNFAPEFFGSWAKYILWLFVTVIGLSLLLKVALSVILTVVNPIIGAVYTFFFSNLFGTQFSKSILTTAILVTIVWGLNAMGLTQFAFADFSLASYGPVCAIAVLALYLLGRLL